MISQDVLDKWLTQNPGWSHVTGAAGAANMFGGPVDAKALMPRVQGASLESFELILSYLFRAHTVLAKWMSGTMTPREQC